MADPYYGEIRMFPFNYPPRDWAYCWGQQINIQQNPALYSILATRYGGDGRTTFNLPNMQGVIPVHQGTGPGLTPWTIAQQAGTNTVALTESQVPSHNHAVNSTISGTATVPMPTDQLYMSRVTTGNAWSNDVASPETTLSPQAVQPFVGGTTPHENRQPFLALNFCICLYGDYPVKPS